MSQYQAIVIGAGLSGAVMAERMASQFGWKVLVLEQREHLAGNCFDEYDAHGVLIHRYGPHLFHTDKPEVFEYLSQFTEWHSYEHRVLSKIDDHFVPIPFNLTSIEKCFSADKAAQIIDCLMLLYGEGARIPILELRKESDPLLAELAEFIYQKAFVNYTSKQWGVAPETISPEVTARVPVVVSRDDRYFTDPFQAVPKHGYTIMVERMLSHPNIDLQLSTPMSSRVTLDWNHQTVCLDGNIFFGPVIYTGMLDQLIPDKTIHLPYRSLRFEHQHLLQAQFQPVATVNYPNEQAFTRITEFKHLTGQQHPCTSIVYEYPCAYEPEKKLEPYYPVFTKQAQKEYRNCLQKLECIPQIVTLGRLAEYRYFDMDDAVHNALSRWRELSVNLRKNPAHSVAFCIDNDFTPYLLLTLHSLLISNGNKFHIYLFVVDLTSKNKNLLLSLLAQFEKYEIIDVDYKEFLRRGIDINYGTGRISLSTYLRLLIPDYVFDEKVLYLDSDLIVTDNISDIFEKCNNSPVAGVIDINLKQRSQDFFGFERAYINAGVLLINTLHWKSERVKEKALAFLSESKEDARVFNDQDAINATVSSIEYLDVFYNYQTYECTRDYLLGKTKKYGVMHYSGAEKPWYVESYHPYMSDFLKVESINNALKIDRRFFLDEDIRNRLDKLSNESLLAIYGYGELGRFVYGYLKYIHQEGRIIGIVDKLIPHHDTVENQILSYKKKYGSEIKFIVCSKCYLDEIESMFSECGVECVSLFK